MFSLIEHIEFLMMSHDCVIVPGWGALIAQYSEPRFNERNGLINKPQRRISFNASVSHNDGLLAQSIVRREGITYDEAVRFIAGSVTTFKQQLAAGTEVSMGRLGYFISSDDQPEFIPFYNESCNDEYFGLRNVTFKTLQQLQFEREAAQQETADHNTTVVHRASWTRRAMQIAASVIVLLIMVPVLTTPILRNDSFASLSLPDVKKPQRAVLNWDSVQVDLAVALPQQAIDANKQLDRYYAKHHHKAQETETVSTSIGSGRFYLVIASLGSEKKAREYMASRRDLASNQMQVLHRGNKYRVYIARDNNRANLNKIRQTLPDRYRDAWVCD